MQRPDFIAHTGAIQLTERKRRYWLTRLKWWAFVALLISAAAFIAVERYSL